MGNGEIHGWLVWTNQTIAYKCYDIPTTPSGKESIPSIHKQRLTHEEMSLPLTYLMERYPIPKTE